MIKYLIEEELYEQPTGLYYSKCGCWTNDPDNALSFSTEKEALDLMSNIILDRIAVVTEHLFE
jgi:hypothetical protein